MKKALVIILAMFVFIGFLYAGSHISTLSPITIEEAIERVKREIDDKSKETIINFDNPKAEEMVFKTQPSIYLFDKEVKLTGKSVYKITFNTTQDGLLGPVVFYVDRNNGEIIGMDYRE